MATLRSVCRKGGLDPFWMTNIFWRPVSLYVSWAAIRFGVSSNQVTAISGVLAVGSSLGLLYASTAGYVTALVLMQTFVLLDCVDGEVGRYQAQFRSPEFKNVSGAYFDRLIHYYHGPSFYLCIGAGLTLAEGAIVWLLLGVFASLGSGGQPRLNTRYQLLGLILEDNRESVRAYARAISGFDSLYWRAEDAPVRFFIIPRTRTEFLFAAKQYIAYPGNVFIFAATAIVDLVRGAGFPFVKAFLVFYAALLTINAIYAIRKYLHQLARVPGESMDSSRLSMVESGANAPSFKFEGHVAENPPNANPQ